MIIYQVLIGSGSIIHFGFLFPQPNEHIQVGLTDVIDSIASTAGLTRLIECNDPQIDVTVHTSRDKHIMFLANTGNSKKKINLDSEYTDVISDQVVGPVIMLEPYSVRILEVISE